MLARSKMVGVWETGEGEQVPLPRQPLPQWRYPHGPQHGEILEKNRARRPTRSTLDTVSRRLHPGYGFPPASPRARFPTSSTPDTAAHLISPRTDPAPGRGRGRSAEGAGGAGAAGRSVWVLPRKSRRSKGASELRGPPLPQARAGWGLPAEAYGYPYEGAGGAAVPARYTATLQRSRQGGDLPAYAAAGKERTPLPAGLSRTSVAFARVYRRRRPGS